MSQKNAERRPTDARYVTELREYTRRSVPTTQAPPLDSAVRYRDEETGRWFGWPTTPDHYERIIGLRP